MFKRNSVAVAVAAILASAMRMGQADAQEAEPASSSETEEQLEEIVVRGLRGSLKASMETKRDAVGVVDAINAEDIGKFPDSNLSEALQRITGISIDRRGGEGALVTARGFGAEYNMVTLNGRMMPAADAYGRAAGNDPRGSGRAFNFANLASESISALEVYKTSRADIATGGIGATINVKTARPFDSQQTIASFGAKGVYDTTNRVGDDITPELSGIFSYANDDRTWGVAVSASHQQRDSGTVGAGVDDWRVQEWAPQGQAGEMELDPGAPVRNAPAAGQLYGLPNDLRYFFSDRTRERDNAQLTLQFAPSDTLVLTTDYTFAENHLQESRGEQALWFIRSASAVEFDTDQEVATPVMISEDVDIGKDHGMAQQFRDQTNTLKSLGFNAEWNISDRFGLSFDLHDSSMESLPSGATGAGEIETAMAGKLVDTQTLYYNTGLPIMNYTLNDSLGNNNGVFDTGDIGTQPLRIFYVDQATDIVQARIDGKLEFDNGRFQFGVETRAMDMKQKQSEVAFQAGDWGIARPGEIPGGLLQPFNIIGEFHDYSTQGAATAAWKSDARALGQWIADNYGANLANSTDWNQNNQVEEDTQAAYFQVALKGELGGRDTHFLAGVRYETTDVGSQSDLLIPTAIRWQDNNDFTIDRASTPTRLSEDTDYDHVLPSFDFDVEVVDNVKARFSYSKTIARAQYEQMRSSVTIRGPGGPTLTGIQAAADASNPALIPLESDNLDLSLEWYIGDSSYVAAGFFEKRVSNFIGNETVEEQFFGLRDVTAGPRALRAEAAIQARADHDGFVNETELFVMAAILDNPQDFPNGPADYDPSGAFATAVATKYDIVANEEDPFYTFLTQRPVNNKDAKLHGFEIGGQHFFGTSGFGLAANYTYVKGDVEFDVNGDPTGGAQFALLGLSDSANAVLMYEKHNFSARLAWNWRDEFLANANRGNFRNPEFVEAYQQWDLSISYDFNPRLTVAFEGLNLTEENVRTHARSERQLWYMEDNGARYQLGARYKF